MVIPSIQPHTLAGAHSALVDTLAEMLAARDATFHAVHPPPGSGISPVQRAANVSAATGAKIAAEKAYDAALAWYGIVLAEETAQRLGLASAVPTAAPPNGQPGL
ncbi:hypothetical protein [Paracraurococcus lichenis]|uniref:PE family protein n=1 Tax=Paracraurococcus lichenis TaxID=3064888 RepID=A0ABT9EBQ2_9PROT|nr:hypothetical protein [Paracraurococcus sp. LOR1-02]MDO9713632.1 hypothetical protein [Paracraurococcus sp. LOR1-02]